MQNAVPKIRDESGSFYEKKMVLKNLRNKIEKK